PALRCGERTWTFRDLAAMARRRADALSNEIARDRPYALVGSNTLETVLTIYALWEIGAAPLLLHPRLTRHERDALRVNADQNGRMDVPAAAAVLYTSGTTGIPRAAILARDAFAASAAANAANLGWRDDDC